LGNKTKNHVTAKRTGGILLPPSQTAVYGCRQKIYSIFEFERRQKKFKKRLRFFFEQKKKAKRWATKLAGSGFSTVRQPTT
jgi:hypothetical protein